MHSPIPELPRFERRLTGPRAAPSSPVSTNGSPLNNLVRSRLSDGALNFTGGRIATPLPQPSLKAPESPLSKRNPTIKQNRVRFDLPDDELSHSDVSSPEKTLLTSASTSTFDSLKKELLPELPSLAYSDDDEFPSSPEELNSHVNYPDVRNVYDCHTGLQPLVDHDCIEDRQKTFTSKQLPTLPLQKSSKLSNRRPALHSFHSAPANSLYPLPTPTSQLPSNLSSNNLFQSDSFKPSMVSSHTSTKPVLYRGNSEKSCHSCGGSLRAGRIISASGKKLHPQCFKCDTCSQNLEHVGFYYREGKFYCHLDYHEQFSPRCKHCKTPIEDQAVHINNDWFHENHHFCAGCSEVFNVNIPCIYRDDLYWCQTCYDNKYAVKCKKCRKPILGISVKGSDGEYHSQCWTCGACNALLGDEGYFMIENTPICRPCKAISVKFNLD
ncbi:LIM domain-containing protein C4F6.12 [Schizosaccharomyces pombe]